MYKVCKIDERLWRLREFLKENRDKKTIVYFLTCACVDYFATAMCDGAPASPGHGVNMVALHGKMKQSQREQALEKFATGSGGCLLCTDVAARGLDIPGVDWVVQFDAPQDPAAFVHRVRAGPRGWTGGQRAAVSVPTRVFVRGVSEGAAHTPQGD